MFLMRTIALLLLCSQTCAAEDWPHWRGADRRDVTVEASLWDGTSWVNDQPMWTAAVGEGGTSPIVIGDRLYAMGWSNDQDTVFCLNTDTGKEIWKSSYRCPRYGRLATGDEGLYSGPTSTPEYDAETGFLYTLSCDGDLNCWDAKQQGSRRWHLNLYDNFHVARRPKIGRSGLRDYGYTTSPLIHGNWVLIEVGADSGAIMAFDKRTGQHVWSSDATGPAGHTGGLVPITVEGLPCVAVLTCYRLLIVRLDEGAAGKTVAEYEWTTNFVNNIATPAVSENFLLITSAYNHNAICKLKVTLSGIEKIWEQPFASKVCSPIIHGGRVYWAWQKLHCLDWETGSELWSGGQFGDAGSCIITGDDRLIIWSGRGTLTLAETAVRSPDAYQERAHLDIRSRSDVWPHVVLAAGRIFCKDRDGHLHCLKSGP
ncbi:MAG: PQQ-binding-like beta-propeller repeat protein [Planctomycetaceae bacterium]|nr:PQQ-binding-like beta-propeller repeat protein [Planctomycetaceae bacterium]